MGIDIGPIEVIDGLVFQVDAANKKSYSGSGITLSGLISGIGATLVNGTGFSSSNGGSFFFDGTNDYINIASQVISSNSSVSLICWAKFNTISSAYKPLIDAGNLGSGSSGYTLSIDNTNKLYIAINSGYVSVSNSVSSKVWYHIVGTASSGTPYSLKLYINGVLGTISASSSTNNLTGISSTTRIGSTILNTGLIFDGNISNVQIYNRALSATEILQNYNATKGRYR